MLETFRSIRYRYLLVAGFLIFSSIAVLIRYTQSAQALNLTNRSLTLTNNTNAGSTATTSYSFSLTVPTGGTATVRGVEVNFCTTPLTGACTPPTGMSATSATMGTTSPVGGGTLATSNSAAPNTALASSGTSARMRFIWGADQALTLPQAVTFAFNNIQNPTTAGTFFARIGFFGAGDITYTTVTDSGTVAQSVQGATNVSFKIQETLSFCVGSMPNATVAFYSGTGAVGTTFAGTASVTDNCAQSSGTTLSLGIAPDSTTTCVTPVTVRTAGCADPDLTTDSNYAYAMARTNAANGVTVGYRVASQTGYTNATLQTLNATCGGFSSANRTDGCINPVNEDQGTALGTADDLPATSALELFGMAVPAKNNQGRATNNLTRNSAATGYGYTGDPAGTCTGGTSTTNCWNWHRTGTGTLATSTAPVDNEAIEMLFATKAGITTPPGLFNVYLDYFANATF